MFGRHFFGAHFYAPRYFGDGGAGAPPVSGADGRYDMMPNKLMKRRFRSIGLLHG